MTGFVISLITAELFSRLVLTAVAAPLFLLLILVFGCNLLLRSPTLENEMIDLKGFTPRVIHSSNISTAFQPLGVLCTVSVAPTNATCGTSWYQTKRFGCAIQRKAQPKRWRPPAAGHRAVDVLIHLANRTCGMLNEP